ncbi:biotin--[acetyl-CoA-carboxylase] ligase [Salegentibacter sediminis]|uniref:biotin--[acetyl-CoA-carboxylase] ligase n=1 Tax=Salegentibacter sediminis TaxID=1930251 RepID=UPI0009BEE81D|nr:biotin--[acetyl-CoA-carboxylase] ligase [Salegentibacter sediminis]
MRIIKVNAINSTNDFARELYRGNSNFDPCCVLAQNQTSGRGQRGSGWMANPGQNLTFSILYPKIEVEVDRQFLFSAGVSVAVVKALEIFNIPNLKVKWPNDIMSGNFKVGGILIENILKNNQISASVIGVGLNVNQVDFPGLPQAASLKMLTGRTFELEEVLDGILTSIEKDLQSISSTNQSRVLEEYAERMFRKDVVSTFQYPDNSFLTGIIRGVTTAGRLNVEIENSVFKTFDLKELRLMY